MVSKTKNTSSVDILKFYKDLNTHLRIKAQSFEGQGSKELSLYQRKFKTYLKEKIKASSEADFLKSSLESNVVFIGDFHTFDQNSKNFIRVLREAKKSKKKFSIAVEFIDHESQSALDAFQKGLISELEFLEQIDYKDSWKFPWIHYRPIFDFCRQNKIKINALNSKGGLKKRDKFAANILSHLLKESPKELIFVLFGELHIIEDHLPSELNSIFKKKLKYTILHQNLEEIYWRLPLDKTQSGSSFWKIRPRVFVLQNSPPWIKYESMIYWYENLVDDPDFDIHEYILETGSKVFSSSATDNFLYLSKLLNETLQLRLSQSEIEDFNLYDSQSLELISQRIGRIPSLKLQKFYRDIIKNGRVFRIAFTKDYYCSHYTINRLTFLAGQHLFYIYLLNKDAQFEDKVFENNNNNILFNYFLMQAFFSYYCSKLINPYRKCNHYIDFKQRENLLRKGSREHKLNLLTIKVIEKPSSLNQSISKFSPIDLFLLARNLGYSLADMSYEIDIKSQKMFSNLYEVINLSLDSKILESIAKSVEKKDQRITKKIKRRI